MSTSRFNFLRLMTGSATAVMAVTVLVYLALSIPLLVVHETVPNAPENPILYNGINITEAWLDLAELTNGHHPFNSHRNDEVHDWLLRRVEEILTVNDIDWSTETNHIAIPDVASEVEEVKPFPGFIGFETGPGVSSPAAQEELRKRKTSPLVTIFNDLQSNTTSSQVGALGQSAGRRSPGQSVYFESTNVIVYIRGTEDEEGEWWKSDLHLRNTHGQGGVLLNAHYDSVSTGYGATDDGVGVISLLQLIRYFTTSGHRPKKGIVALFNNGEEDGLHGARAFSQHPMSLFTHTFVNLEGAGAGGRAVLFRTTDAEVTKAYKKSPHPFGTIIGGDGFKTGFIRSQTDYVVFDDILGMRGLDIAFWQPRARYHTDQDDLRHTSRDSIWHMLSAALHTTKELASDTSSTFNAPRADHARGKVNSGKGSNGVWYDLFGKAFVLFQLRTLFAWSLTFLIVGPLAIAVLVFLLIRNDKFYFFSANTSHGPTDQAGELIPLQGWRGAFRWPVTIIAAAALTFGSAFLLKKVNPLIVYSSPYAVWAMMFSLNLYITWFGLRGADFVRPTALQRGYAYMWMYLLSWVILVFVTALEDRYKIAGGYPVVFYNILLFFAVMITLGELFFLPTKEAYADLIHTQQDTQTIAAGLPDSDVLTAPTIGGGEASTSVADEHDYAANGAEENTPLLGGQADGSDEPNGQSSFARITKHLRRTLGAATDGASESEPHRPGPTRSYRSHLRRVSQMLTSPEDRPYGREQTWSGKLPRWTWLAQFLLVGPFMIMLLGQTGLFLVAAMNQTGPDGSNLLLPYILVAVFSIFLIGPITPTIHRWTYHIPTFLFLVFIGTTIYSLVAFPFSANNRYKAYWQQTVDLDTGINEVAVSGLEEYVRPIIAAIPSAAGQPIVCGGSNFRSGVTSCTYTSLPPSVIPVKDGVPPETTYKDWLTFNVTREEGTNTATFTIQGKDTRTCAIRFDGIITSLSVAGAGSDDRFEKVPESGSKEVKLWHRNWNEPWEVTVEWPVSEGKKLGEEGLDGRVVCGWSDVNKQDVIPALDEAYRYAPEWVAWSKWNDGLVEGSKGFKI